LTHSVVKLASSTTLWS